jgi:hypothetical protein
MYFFDLKITPPIPWRDSNSRPITPRAKTIPLDHAMARREGCFEKIEIVPMLVQKLNSIPSLIRVARFFFVSKHKKYTKLLQTVPNGHTIHLVDVKYSKWS